MSLKAFGCVAIFADHRRLIRCNACSLWGASSLGDAANRWAFFSLKCFLRSPSSSQVPSTLSRLTSNVLMFERENRKKEWFASETSSLSIDREKSHNSMHHHLEGVLDCRVCFLDSPQISVWREEKKLKFHRCSHFSSLFCHPSGSEGSENCSI